MQKTLSRLSTSTLGQIMRGNWTGKPLVHDGGGLYLAVNKNGGGAWSYRYMADRKQRELGLGSLCQIGPADARSKAQQLRDQLRGGVDPLAERRVIQAKQDITKAHTVALLQTFDAEAALWIEAQRAAGITSQTVKNFERYQRRAREAGIGAMVLDAIQTQHIADLLKPWTADERKRARQFFRNVFIHGKAAGRSSTLLANPVDNLVALLPKIAKGKAIEKDDADMGRPDEALPWQQVPELVAKLVARPDSPRAQALLMVVLSGLRAQEVYMSRAREFNADKGEWTKPASHMKQKKEHIVPISNGIKRVFEKMNGVDDTWLFPGLKGQHVDGSGMLKLLQDDLGYKGRTVRGLRRTLRNWGGEYVGDTGVQRFGNDAMECTLAHKVATGVSGHYYTLTHYAERAKILDAWASYCFTGIDPSNVVSLKRVA